MSIGGVHFYVLFSALTVSFQIVSCSNLGSCVYGSERQGRCLDRIGGTPSRGPCVERYCRAGWTCACLARTHLCPLKNTTRSVVDSLSGSQLYCRDEEIQNAGLPYIKLGSWTIGISRKALLENECKDLNWWLNGELMGEYGETPRINRFNVDSELQRRGTHTAIELKRGDLLSFRFRDASYHCFTHVSDIQVDGQLLRIGDTGLSITFARQFSQDWNEPSFTPNFANDEDLALPTDFLPLRTNFFSDGSTINAGWDYWTQPDGTRDHEKGNFYYRVQL